MYPGRFQKSSPYHWQFRHLKNSTCRTTKKLRNGFSRFVPTIFKRLHKNNYKTASLVTKHPRLGIGANVPGIKKRTHVRSGVHRSIAMRPKEERRSQMTQTSLISPPPPVNRKSTSLPRLQFLTLHFFRFPDFSKIFPRRRSHGCVF